jgi:hypothetical protein
MIHYLPYLLSAVTALSTWMAGNKDPRAWLIALGNQVLWTVWVFGSHTWGFIPLNLFLWYTYFRNYRLWRSHEHN